MDVQLELPIAEKDHMAEMQKQLDEMRESMGKVRRKIFSEVGELKKLCIALQLENQGLKEQIREIKGEKTQWIYKHNDCLFEAM